MNQDLHTQIKKVIEIFLTALQMKGEVEISPLTEKKYLVKVRVSEDQGALIGKQGSTLEALQHIIAILSRKDQGDDQYRLDVNDYQQSRDQVFLERVREYVIQKEESAEILLWPMTPYERRLVHEFFLQEGTHTTQSEDFGSRRVVRVIKK